MKLKLPIGIRPLFDYEYPKGNDIVSINRAREAANIFPGYKINLPQGPSKFSVYTEVNVDTSDTWSLFLALVRGLIPKSAYGIIGLKDEEYVIGDFVDREELIDLFSKYQFELTNDGLLAFGVASYDDTILNEVLVETFKYLKIWTTNTIEMIDILKSFGIYKKPDLNFIDEYPVASLTLSSEQYPGVRQANAIVS